MKQSTVVVFEELVFETFLKILSLQMRGENYCEKYSWAVHSFTYLLNRFLNEYLFYAMWIYM